jgi:hypothetical protein
MKKKTVAKGKKRASLPPKKPAPRKLAAAIDFPQENEAVRPGHYSIRVTATGATQAQVRVGAREWTNCRESVGHFWRDWAPTPGAFDLAVRARRGKGRWCAVVVRGVNVE